MVYVDDARIRRRGRQCARAVGESQGDATVTACVVNNPEDCVGPCRCGARPSCPSCGRLSECGRVVCLLRRRLTACPGDRIPPPYDEDAPPSLDT